MILDQESLHASWGMATHFDNVHPTPGQDKSSIVFTVGVRMKINAPPEHVFKTITNFVEYKEWNRDTPKIELLSSETLQIGSNARMKILMVEQNREYEVPIEIVQLENPDQHGTFILAWRGKLLPAWFATTERVQEIRALPNEPNSCEIYNFESMSGWGAYLLKYVMGIPGQLKNFNTKYLEDLQRHAERTWG